jgi:hypothetical protein
MFNSSRLRLLAIAASIASAACLLVFTTVTAFAHGNKSGLDIKIRAENRSDSDTPAFCPGFGPGLVGDSLSVDVSTDIDGNATGTAVFAGADGTDVVMEIDKVFVFFGGMVLMESSTRNSIPIWLGSYEEAGPNYNPVHVNVEFPRGCGNTVSTFTVDADKVTTQIKFQ